VGTTYSLWPIVGFGADTWDKSKPLDDSFGFAGPKCAVAVNGVCYYWSPRGPMRVAGLNRPEPLWDLVADTVPQVVTPEKLVAAFDPEHDQVVWFYRKGTATGNQFVCAFDVRRNVFVGPDRDVGILVGAANFIAPVTAAALASAPAPTAAPTTPVTSEVSALSARAAWVNGDTSLGVETDVQVRRQSVTAWTDVTTLPAGTSTTVVTVPTAGVAYEWRCVHRKNGQLSAYLGPSASTQFTTNSVLQQPTNVILTDNGPGTENQGYITWFNSGEPDVQTEIYLDNVYYGRANFGDSSYYITVYSTDVYTVKLRHVRSGFTSSDFTSDVSATLTVD